MTRGYFRNPGQISGDSESLGKRANENGLLYNRFFLNQQRSYMLCPFVKHISEPNYGFRCKPLTLINLKFSPASEFDNSELLTCMQLLFPALLMIEPSLGKWAHRPLAASCLGQK